jgi:hypothetical protein
VIVLEGADNSGKSTLARSLGLPYFSAGPAPTSESELKRCLDEQRARSKMICVQDRLTCISQQIYSEELNKQPLRDELEYLAHRPGVIIVYCRPPERILMDLSTHKVKSYDTEENLSKIIANQHVYVRRYDTLMSSIPHFIYDWTDSIVETHEVISHLIDTQHDAKVWQDTYERMTIVARQLGMGAA